MTIRNDSKIRTWTCEPLSTDLKQRLDRMAEFDDVLGIAVMPDVHLTPEYCVGTAVATRTRILPHAIGGDIGCGMAAIRINCDADVINQKTAPTILRMLNRFVPSNRQAADLSVERLPEELMRIELSDERLERLKYRDARVQFGTLGRGNHFLEFQSDSDQQLWLMIHSGSRSIGQSISTHHLRLADSERKIVYFDDETQRGKDYLHDARWASQYASANRRHMLWTTCELLTTVLGVEADSDSLVESDHNHVRRETHSDIDVWVHRKGAQAAGQEMLGIIPGSMGSASYHVLGRGCAESFASSSHGAGRKMSRGDARRRTTRNEFMRLMEGVFFDLGKAAKLVDESPSAYKDIRKVMKAQKELVKIIRELRPILSYKGT